MLRDFGDRGPSSEIGMSAIWRHGREHWCVAAKLPQTGRRDAERRGQLARQLRILVQVMRREELVQRRIQQADGDRAIAHHAVQVSEILPLEFKQFCKSGFPI